MPQPDGPITATSSPGADGEVDATQGVHLGLAPAVGLDDVDELEDRRWSSRPPFTGGGVWLRRGQAGFAEVEPAQVGLGAHHEGVGDEAWRPVDRARRSLRLAAAQLQEGERAPCGGG